MGILLAIIGLFYFCLFLFILFLFYLGVKKEGYQKNEGMTFLLTSILGTVIAFFVTNHLALSIENSSVMKAIGYSAVPITQAALVLLSYSVVNIYYYTTRRSIKYGPLFLGFIFSAPLTFGLNSLVAVHYWRFLGKSIYG